jgi:hypothetical protein
LLDSLKKDSDRFKWEMAVGDSVEQFLCIKAGQIWNGTKISYKSSQPGLI